MKMITFDDAEVDNIIKKETPKKKAEINVSLLKVDESSNKFVKRKLPQDVHPIKDNVNEIVETLRAFEAEAIDLPESERLPISFNPFVDTPFDKNGYTSYPYIYMTVPWRSDVMEYAVRNSALFLGKLRKSKMIDPKENYVVTLMDSFITYKSIVKVKKGDRGYRKKAYVEFFSAVALDLDFKKGEHKYEEIEQWVRNCPYTCFLYSSKNHLVEDKGYTMHKARVIFPLSRLIEMEKHNTVATNFLRDMEEYGFVRSDDGATKNSAGYWHPTRDGFLHLFHQGKRYEPDDTGYKPSAEDKRRKQLYESLVERGSDIDNENSKDKTELLENAFLRNMEITLGNNEIKRVMDVDMSHDTTRLHCPFSCCTSRERQGNDANAVLNFSDKNNRYTIYCYSNKTLYIEGERIGQYNVSDFLKNGVPFSFYDTSAEIVRYVEPHDPCSLRSCIKDRTYPKIMQSYGGVPYEEIKLRSDFIPTLDYQIDFVSKKFNHYRATEYLKKAPVYRSHYEFGDITEEDFPWIARVIENLIPKKEERDRFYNYLATVYNTRKKVITAWVFRTKKKGCGKNMFFEHVIKPLFGHNHCMVVENKDLHSNFNGYMQGQFFIAFDEVVSSNSDRNRTHSFVKSIITDDFVTINEKNVPAYSVNNHINIMFFSNDAQPLYLEMFDRRFNVPNSWEAEALHNLDWWNYNEFCKQSVIEMDLFAAYLSIYPYNIDKANRAMDSEVKDTMINASVDRWTIFSDKLKNGDAEWVIESLNDPSTIALTHMTELGLINTDLKPEEKIEDHIRECFADRRMRNTLMIDIFNDIFASRSNDNASGKKFMTNMLVRGISIKSVPNRGKRFYHW
jgi:hypothetical protein